MKSVLICEAFSLTELMVTIAIVTLISAVAIPAYSGYIIKSKIKSIETVAMRINQESINYFNTHDVASYPTATQLGYGTTMDIVDNPDNMIPIAQSILIGDNSDCGSGGYVVIEIKPDEFMGPSSAFLFECDIYNVDGQLSRKCFYEAYDANGVLITEDYIPEWHNAGADGWQLWDDMSTASECQ